MFICKHTGEATEETAANREQVAEFTRYNTNAQNKQFAKAIVVMNVIFLVIDQLSLSMNIY